MSTNGKGSVRRGGRREDDLYCTGWERIFGSKKRAKTTSKPKKK